jgi:hypothetical protein
MNEQIFILTSQKKTTNHTLHLLLCIPTFGLWLIIWAGTVQNNNSHNRKIDKQIKQIMEYKLRGLSDSDTYQQGKIDKANSDIYKGRVIFVVIIVVFLYIYLR